MPFGTELMVAGGVCFRLWTLAAKKFISAPYMSWLPGKHGDIIWIMRINRFFIWNAAYVLALIFRGRVPSTGDTSRGESQAMLYRQGPLPPSFRTTIKEELLAPRVREERQREFARFPEFSDSTARAQIPDPARGWRARGFPGSPVSLERSLVS